jgi:hypothetical protein
MGKGKEIRGTVRTRWDPFGDLSSPRDGWTLPRELELDAELPGDIQVHMDVDVRQGKARARSVTISTTKPHGVGWTALTQVPVRDLVATAVRDALLKSVPTSESSRELVPPGAKDAEEVREVVQVAVGYRPDVEGFERVSGDAS